MFRTMPPYFWGIVPIEKGAGDFACPMGATSDKKV